MLNLKGRRGNTATTFALLTPVLMATTAMGVDWGAISVAKYQVQAAADAAALAATSSMENPAVALGRAESYASRVQVNGRTPQVTDLSIGTWNADTRSFTRGGNQPNAVKVKTAVPMPLYFSALMGKTELTLHAEAGAGPRVLPRRAPDTPPRLPRTDSSNRFACR